MIRPGRAVHRVFSSSRFAVLAAFPLLAALSVSTVACGDGGGGGAGGSGGGDGGGGSTGATTDTNTNTGTDTGGTTTGGGQVMLSCGENLSFVASCTVEGSTYTACSDFFGVQNGLEAQCAANNGTYSTTPCVLDNRAGACVFYNSALPDRCYVEHIAPPSAADFWEMTCPQAGGSWTPAE